MKLSVGRMRAPLKVVVYGPEGIGKSTFASFFPGAIFIDTEGSTKHMDVTRVEPAPKSWTELKEMVRQLSGAPYVDGYQTLVVDTADWAEKLCMESLCASKNVSGIEDFGYGKGYTYLAEEFGKLLNLLDDVIQRGNNVVVTAHAAMRKFEQPDELGAYDRWELKLQKKTAPLLKEWADMVLFANYKTIVVNVDNQGAAKGKNKVQGGSRVMYTSHHPCWDAKNRFGLPEEMAFDYAGIAHLIPVTPPEMINSSCTPPEAQNLPSNAPAVPVKETPAPMPSEAAMPQADDEPVPEALRRMMDMDGVTAEEIRKAVAKVGFYPEDTPIMMYEEAFVAGMLIADWAGVLRVIEEIRKDAVPF